MNGFGEDRPDKFEAGEAVGNPGEDDIDEDLAEGAEVDDGVGGVEAVAQEGADRLAQKFICD